MLFIHDSRTYLPPGSTNLPSLHRFHPAAGWWRPGRSWATPAIEQGGVLGWHPRWVSRFQQMFQMRFVAKRTQRTPKSLIDLLRRILTFAFGGARRYLGYVPRVCWNFLWCEELRVCTRTPHAPQKKDNQSSWRDVIPRVNSHPLAPIWQEPGKVLGRVSGLGILLFGQVHLFGKRYDNSHRIQRINSGGMWYFRMGKRQKGRFKETSTHHFKMFYCCWSMLNWKNNGNFILLQC